MVSGYLFRVRSRPPTTTDGTARTPSAPSRNAAEDELPASLASFASGDIPAIPPDESAGIRAEMERGLAPTDIDRLPDAPFEQLTLRTSNPGVLPTNRSRFKFPELSVVRTLGPRIAASVPGWRSMDTVHWTPATAGPPRLRDNVTVEPVSGVGSLVETLTEPLGGGYCADAGIVNERRERIAADITARRFMATPRTRQFVYLLVFLIPPPPFGIPLRADMRGLCCCALAPVNAGIAVMCKAMINALSSCCCQWLLPRTGSACYGYTAPQGGARNAVINEAHFRPWRHPRPAVVTMRLISPLHRRRATPVRWITDDLAISAAPPPEQWRELHAQGIRAALDLRTIHEGGGCDTVPAELAYRSFPIEDGSAPALADLLDVSSWLTSHLRSGSRVMINCREGRGRSALVACATLIQLGYSLESAYRVVRRGQPQIALSDDQVKVLEGLSRS